MIQQSAFFISHGFGGFIGIVAFDATQRSALTAAKIQWGTEATYKELTAHELYEYTKRGISVFTASCQ